MKILFLGHSLVAFFDWQSRFPAHRVDNLGVAGETAEGLLARLDRVSEARKAPDVVCVMTGTNDIVMEHYDFFETYRSILQNLKKAFPLAHIVIHTIPPIALEWADPEAVRQLNGRLESMARREEVTLIDLHRKFVDEEGRPRRDCFIEDGVHLSQRGYAIWSEALEEILFPE